MKILVVDDDNNKVVAVSRVVESAGVDLSSVEVATTAAGAMRKLEEEAYDLLVVDLVLPLRIGEAPSPGGGVQLVQAIHRSDRIKMPEFIVGLTADREALLASKEQFSNLLWSIELSGHDQSEWKLRLQQKILHLQAREAQRTAASTTPVECDVLFVCALLDPEIEQLHLASGAKWTQVSYQGDPTLYWTAILEIDGKRCRAHSTCLPQMGLVAAATGVSQAVRTLTPGMVVMTGICAGRKGDCDLGDVIAANITWDYGSGKFVEVEGRRAFEPAPVHVLCDASVQSRMKAMSADKELLRSYHQASPGFRPAREPKLHVGPLASGAAVQNYPEFFSGVADQNRKILGVDMEAFGVAWSCHQSIEPHPRWLIVKAVSDFADGSKNNEYQQYASFISARVALGAISSFI